MPLTRLGRYEITGTLGLGAMGIVYKAHDPLIERTVAIKTVGWAGLTREETDEFVQRFFQEAKSAGRLNHPNIVTIYDTGRSDDLAFITMEFLDGRSLREILDSGVVLPLSRIAEIAAGIADGLAFAHASGVVHRDIKPANIMVLDNGTAKITDFGVAHLAGGSPSYMAPEQIAGKKADGRSDIFSLGAILYEMLTGHPPFTGDNPAAVLKQVLTSGAPPLASSHNPDLPGCFDRIVARALDKNPEQRYQDAAEMATDLRNCGSISELLLQEEIPDSELLVADIEPPAVTKPVVSKSADDDSEPIGAVAPPKKRWLGFRYNIELVVLGVLVGILLLPPAPPTPPTEAATLPAAPLPPSSGESAAQGPGMPLASDPPAKAADSQMPPASAERKAEEVKVTKTASPQKPAAQAIEQKAEPAAASTWKAALHADLAACERKSFVPRIYCQEKARWKHCPGHWGSVEECPLGNNAREP